MGGTIKNEREKLGSQLRWLERWVVSAGFAVAVGVAIEIGSKILKREIDNEVIGGAIVILGVAIEVILTFVAAQKTSRIFDTHITPRRPNRRTPRRPTSSPHTKPPQLSADLRSRENLRVAC
jgi:hypothetical protein